MPTLLRGTALGLIALVLSSPQATSADREWTDLLAQNLKGWSRSEVGRTPWRMTVEGTLLCERGNELLVPDREFADGTLKFEYRFRTNGEKKGFKAAVWVRRSTQGTGCRVALGDDCGTLSASFQAASDRTKTVEEKPLAKAAKPAGEWNEVRFVLAGRTVNVFVNDKQVASFSQCDTNEGLIALEAEGSTIEFRELMWKGGK
jgi:hypothetical protein